MYPLLILFFIMLGIILIYFINKYTLIMEKFYGGDLSPFTNFNLTKKPIANYAPYPIHTWWKYGYNCGKYKDCDQYRYQNQQFNAYNAKSCFNVVNHKYTDPVVDKSPFTVNNPSQQCAFYENATKYCMLNPNDHRCPNHWLTQ